jgi:hypothetical protein
MALGLPPNKSKAIAAMTPPNPLGRPVHGPRARCYGMPSSIGAGCYGVSGHRNAEIQAWRGLLRCYGVTTISPHVCVGVHARTHTPPHMCPREDRNTVTP